MKMVILIGTISCFVLALTLIVLTDEDILRPAWRVSGPGADIVMLFAQKYPEIVSKVIALDNGQVPILRTKKPRILSLRSNNVHPENGVLPTPEEQKKIDIQIVMLKDISHLDMCFGSTDQKDKINKYITDFLKKD